jgi:predicted transcriptional regulator
MSKPGRSTVVTLRLPPDLDRRIEREARRKRRTKSAVVREALQSVFGAGHPPDDPAREARRQSLLVSGRASERDALEFIDHAADVRGWR